jgi:hypothetical protein
VFALRYSLGRRCRIYAGDCQLFLNSPKSDSYQILSPEAKREKEGKRTRISIQITARKMPVGRRMSCGLLEIYTLNKLATRASTYKGFFSPWKYFPPLSRAVLLDRFSKHMVAYCVSEEIPVSCSVIQCLITAQLTVQAS